MRRRVGSCFRTCEKKNTCCINRESAESADLIVSRLLKPEFVRTDLPLILAMQETRSWDTDEMHVPGSIVNGNKFGLTASLCPKEWGINRGLGVLRRDALLCYLEERWL